MKDIFDEVIADRKKSDIFDEVIKERTDLFAEASKAILPEVKSYVKAIQKNQPKPLNAYDIATIVKDELSKVKAPPQKIVERVIEKQILKTEPPKKETPKEIVDKEARKELEKTKEKIDDLKKELDEFPLPMPGGSGVLGLPNPAGQSGKYLTTDGNKFSWSTVVQGSGSESVPLPGTITRSNGYISSIALEGGKTYTISRSGSYISSITDGTKTWTYTRNGSNQITSWSIT